MDSILKGSYPAFRVVVVDDQSTDGSFEFVLEHYSTNPKVKIIRRENNGGLSAARNTGLAESTATFIQFWDADDIYYSQALSSLVESAVIGMSEIVTGIAERSGEVLPAYQLAKANVNAIKQPFCHLAFQTMSTCFKLYRRDFLTKHNLTFVEGLFMQDTELNLRAFAVANSVSMTDVNIGEYIDGGKGRGSQHVSEARMRSALDIYEISKSTAESDPRMPADYSDFIILKFVFRFFVSKLLPPDTFAKHFASSVNREQYLEVFRTHISKMTPGVCRLFESTEKNDWRWGVAFGLMQLGQDKEAEKAIKLSRPDPQWFKQIADTLSEHLGIEHALIHRRLQMMGMN
jgi:glycosyltransferase involved in cell wall biosynthesis